MESLFALKSSADGAIVAGFGAADDLLIGRRDRSIRAFSATSNDGQPPCRALAEDSGRTQPRAAIPGAAAPTRVVCVGGIRLGSGESARAFKGIIWDDISEFKSVGYVQVAELWVGYDRLAFADLLGHVFACLLPCPWS
jgi:hypothetical protein